MSDQNETIDITLERIHAALEGERYEDAKSLFFELHPADQAEIFNLLSDSQRDTLLAQLDIPQTADLLEELEDEEVLEAVEDLSNDRLADLLDEMEPDEAADLLGDLPPLQASQVLAQMEDAEEVRPLLGYPDETAGGLMTTWFIVLRRHTTVDQAIQFLREISPDTEIPYYLYVVDREKRLIGVTGLRELVISPSTTRMEAIMDPDVTYATVGTDQEEVAHIMTRYDLTSLPVVDDQHRLVGVITHDDIIDVVEDEATEDILRLGGIEPGPAMDKPYWSQKLSEIIRSRFIWLLVLFVAETFTGTVLRHYEKEVEAVVALSFFVPLLIGTGGNAGSQTVSTVIRALALREIRTRDALRVLAREWQAGLILGVLVGLVGFGRAMLWGVEIELAITVSITVAVIILWATTVASVIPMLASTLKIDPTVISGPLMATLIDGTGLIIYFSLAALILPELR